MNNLANVQYILPKQDFVFKQCLGKKERSKCLESFIQNVLNIEVIDVEIQGQVELKKYFKNDKAGRLDIQAKSNKMLFDIEMQLSSTDFSCIRTMIYWSKSFLDQGQEGKLYKEYSKAIAMWIVDFKIFSSDRYISRYRIKGDDNQTNIFDCLTIYVIELPKFKMIKRDLNNLGHLWLSFLVAENEEEIQLIKGRNEYVDQCIKEVERMNSDEEMRELQRIWEKTQQEEINMKYEAKQEGLRQGKQEGRKIQLENTIKRMLNMKVNVQLMCSITGLNKKQVNEIIKQLEQEKITN